MAEHSGETLAPLKDRHDDGRPMTQDEIDAYWLAHVYRPNERQLTVRAVVTGMVLGGVMSLSNLYVGLKTGWGLAVTVTAAVLAFGVFSALRRIAPVGPFRQEFTSLENNVMASSASAAGYFTGAGMTSAVPALFMATGRTLGPWELAFWILAVSFLGVLLAVPMRRQMIDVDRLPFPEGLAYAETIRSLHSAPGEARSKALALGWGALVAAAVKLAGSVMGFVKPAVALKAPILPEHLPLFERFLPLTLGIQTDILMMGAGAIMGLRIGVGLLLGSVLAFGVLGTWLHTHGLSGAALTFGGVRNWLVWPGVTVIVVSGLLAFALKWRTALAALSGLGRLASGTRQGGMAEIEVPTKWFLWGTLACTVMTVALAKVIFDIPPWMGLLAVILSVLLSIVACRATGETSITPVGPLGKITQLMYGGIAAGNIQTNLMTASVTAGAAMHSADLLTDLKGGYVLGGKPRNQFVSQFFGVLAGAVFCVPAYLLLATPERLGSTQFPAPAAKTWQAVAELLATGVSTKQRGHADAAAATIQALPVAPVPAGTAPGDVVRMSAGPGAEFRVAAVVDKALVLDRAPSGVAPGTAVEIVGRGRAVVAAPPRELVGLRLTPLPEGTARGDYLRYDAGGHDLWWAVKGVVGPVAVVDRPIVDPRGETPRPLHRALRVEVRKESLPPYALVATLVALIYAIAATLLETYAPARVRRFIPSTTGLGLGFVIAGFDSISMFLGALLAFAIEKTAPRFAERFNIPVASGIMAGASLAGILVIVLSQVVPVLVTP
jgi:putative OPT family oligopeptide transporter